MFSWCFADDAWTRVNGYLLVAITVAWVMAVFVRVL
jgi:hypothetical protein